MAKLKVHVGLLAERWHSQLEIIALWYWLQISFFILIQSSFSHLSFASCPDVLSFIYLSVKFNFPPHNHQKMSFGYLLNWKQFFFLWKLVFHLCRYFTQELWFSHANPFSWWRSAGPWVALPLSWTNRIITEF